MCGAPARSRHGQGLGSVRRPVPGRRGGRHDPNQGVLRVGPLPKSPGKHSASVLSSARGNTRTRVNPSISARLRAYRRVCRRLDDAGSAAQRVFSSEWPRGLRAITAHCALRRALSYQQHPAQEWYCFSLKIHRQARQGLDGLAPHNARAAPCGTCHSPARKEVSVTRLHTYVVVTDLGLAPNPFHGVCTLAVCKPVIRRTARVGDWILGTGSKTRGRQGRAVYAMQVAETLDFEAYWRDPRFRAKRPDPAGSPSRRAGDNLHWFDPATRNWNTVPGSYHDRAWLRQRDLRGLQVLIAWDFVYWGGEGPPVPPCADVNVVCSGRGHRNGFPPEAVDAFAAWVRATGLPGRVGWPLTWGPDTQAAEAAARRCGSHSPPRGQADRPKSCSAASRRPETRVSAGCAPSPKAARRAPCSTRGPIRSGKVGARPTRGGARRRNPERAPVRP